MRKNLKNFSIVSVLLLSLVTFTSGCASDNNTNDSAEKRPGLDARQANDLTGDRNINKDIDTVPDEGVRNDNLNGENMNNRDDDSMLQRSKSITDKLNSDMAEINNSNVVVTGNTALVGVDISNETSDEKISEIKNKVETKVKDIDKNIDKVVVTADPDVVTRLKDMGKDIENGKPISGFGEEIEEIIRRITPNM